LDTYNQYYFRLTVLILCIWFGIKGNTWAWQNKRYESINAFHEDQRRWAIVAIVQIGIYALLLLIAIIGVIATLSLPALMTNTIEKQNITTGLKSQNTLYEVVTMNEAYGEKCELTSNGLAACFSKQMSTSGVNGNVLEARDGTVWTFSGNGRCKNSGDCKVTVKSSKKANSEEVLSVPLYVNAKGFIYVKDEDLFKNNKLSSYDKDYDKEMKKIDQDLKKLEEELKKYENMK